jgi:hypothetical protein
MEANLPVEERFKNFQRGFESPISVADQVHGGGDNVPGVQTVAFNLPNDERVREAKGAKKVILRNVLGAKYERILKPMASLVLVEGQAGNVTRSTWSWKPCSIELSHSLGPGSITVGGRKTTVDQELKEIAGGFEEAKADVMARYNVFHMMDEGVIPNSERSQMRATYVAGLFRRCASVCRKRTARERRCSTAICGTKARSSGTRMRSASASTRRRSTARSAPSSATSCGCREAATMPGPRRSSTNGAYPTPRQTRSSRP